VYICHSLFLIIFVKDTLIRLSELLILAGMAILCSCVVLSILLELLGVIRMMNCVHQKFIFVDEMANNDLFQLNPIPNQYGVYLDLVYCNFPNMVGVGVAESSLLRLDGHLPALILVVLTYIEFVHNWPPWIVVLCF
jgi:hypothetical protein